MKAKKRFLLGVCAGLLVGAAALTAVSVLTADAPQNDLLLANAEALSQGEGQDYNNAKLAYCSNAGDRVGCKSALFRKCTGIFCM